MTKNTRNAKWKQAKALVFIGFLLLALLGLLSACFDGIKPTAAYVEASLVPAILAVLITLLVVGGIMYSNYKETPSRYDNLGSILLPILFAFATYQFVQYSIPMLVHSVSRIEPIKIEVYVTDKTTSSFRGSRLRGCRYKIHFTHPDIPRKNFFCVSSTTWDRIAENAPLRIPASKSSVAYYIGRLRVGS
ncbi:MAG: hypothetical protein AAF614_37910 [Chloroflexota bacterium]